MTHSITASTASGTVIGVLKALEAAGQFTLVDTQLAAMVLRRGDIREWSDAAINAVAFAVAFTSRACREGHSAIHLEQIVEQFAEQVTLAIIEAHDAPTSDGETLVVATLLPQLNPGDVCQWRTALETSSAVGNGSTRTPFVLNDNLLQFARYYDAEERIARNVLRRIATRTITEHTVAPFMIVTGGPGTGKTTFVAQTIVELQQTHPTLRVALAAPTGKAAARMTESVRQRISETGSPANLETPTIVAARTLHRLLQYQGSTDRYRRSEAAPLDDDLVIVDEASMVDVLMFDALLRALKPDAGIMLVGDHHQLASVEAGDVLGALCRVGLADAPNVPRQVHVIVLSKSWRFAAQPGIGALASAILTGDSTAALLQCRQPEVTDVRHMPWPQSNDELLAPILPELERCLAATTPTEFLDAFESFRILTPEREGDTGVSGINRSVEQWFAARGRASNGDWYHGRPVMVTANDYSTNIFNGDVGVVWRDAGHTAVYFRSEHVTLRAVSPARLPAVETAWAVTVHKAQGSEFDSVVVVVPAHESRVMGRELLYTAVTRARRQVTIVGAATSIRKAIERTAARTSGLASALRRLSGTVHGTNRGR